MKTDNIQLNPIGVFARWAGLEERRARTRLHNFRDIALAQANREENGDARAVLYLAGQLANSWVFRRADIRDLVRIVRAVGQMFVAGDNVGQAESSNAE